MNYSSFKDESILFEWVSVRSRIGRSKRGPKDLKRSTAAKRAWKKHRSRMASAIKRWHESPSGKRFHRTLSRFNKNKRGRVTESEFELMIPVVTLSLSEHMSWIMSQHNFRLYEDVFSLQELIGYISDDPEILEDILEDVL
ncbi:MAG: hypothetical protein ACTSXD_02025 [Candidatus Heimdallarchaeaceae archaeon]